MLPQKDIQRKTGNQKYINAFYKLLYINVLNARIQIIFNTQPKHLHNTLSITNIQKQETIIDL